MPITFDLGERFTVFTVPISIIQSVMPVFLSMI